MSADPQQNVFAAAVHWLEAALLGTVGTSVAVIAVASIGWLMLSGRVELRRAAQLVFGCFILFGASSIAAGIVHFFDDGGAPAEAMAPPAPPLASPAAPIASKAAPFDPYAGAALPTRR